MVASQPAGEWILIINRFVVLQTYDIFCTAADRGHRRAAQWSQLPILQAAAASIVLGVVVFVRFSGNHVGIDVE